MTLGAIVLPLFGLVVGLSLLYFAWRIVRIVQKLEQPPKNPDKPELPAQSPTQKPSSGHSRPTNPLPRNNKT